MCVGCSAFACKSFVGVGPKSKHWYNMTESIWHDRAEHVIGQNWQPTVKGDALRPPELGSPGVPWMSLGRGMPSLEHVSASSGKMMKPSTRSNITDIAVICSRVIGCLMAHLPHFLSRLCINCHLMYWQLDAYHIRRLILALCIILPVQGSRRCA